MISYYNKKNILILGGLGLIGSNLANKLAALNANITIVDSLDPSGGGNLFNIDSIKDKVKTKIVNINNKKRLKEFIMRSELIFNTVGELGHKESIKKPEVDLKNNCTGQLALLELCRKYNRNIKIIYCSTRQVYGKIKENPVNEEHPVNPVDINGIHKLLGEMYHKFYNNNFGIKTCLLRLTNVYGPGMRIKDDKQGFIGWFINRALNGRTITIYGDGEMVRDAIHVNDVISALLLIGSEPKCSGEVFNVGSGEKIRLHDMAKSIIKTAGRGRIVKIPYPKDLQKINIGSYRADYSRLSELTGWKPEFRFSEAIKDTVSFYRDHSDLYL